MNYSLPDQNRGIPRIRARIVAYAAAASLLLSSCSVRPGETPLVVIGNTPTPEPTKALDTRSPTPTGTNLPTRTSTPTNTPTQTPTVKPVESATPNWRSTVEAYEKRIKYGELYDTVQMIEFIERQCNLGCYEKVEVVKSQPQAIGSNKTVFGDGSNIVSFTLDNINASSTYTSERGLTYLTDASLLADINKILIDQLDSNKDSRKKNYAETRLLDLILGNRDKKISPFNNFKILLQKFNDGTFALVAYLEVDNCAVVPVPTYTVTSTPTPFFSTPTATSTPRQPDNTPVPSKPTPRPAPTVVLP